MTISPNMPLALKYSAIEVLFAKLSSLPVPQTLGLVGVFGLASFNSVDLRDPDIVATVGLDARVLLKLVIVGVCLTFAIYSLITDHRVRQVLCSLPGACLMLICGLFFLSSLTATQPIFAGVSAVSIATAILATISLSIRIGPRQTTIMLCAAVSTFLIASWLVYLLVPSLGVYKEPIAGGQFVSRMAGLAHPNVLGQYSGLAALLAISLTMTHRRTWTSLALVLPILVLGGAALVLSICRSSFLALLLALLVILGGGFFKGTRILWLAIAVTVGSSTLLVASLTTDWANSIERRLAKSLSKSGEAEELTSATGRTIIWKYTLKLIGERPLIGYGLTSSKSLLIDHNSFTHNMILNVALSSGAIAAGVLVLLMALQLYKLLARPSLIADGLLVFFILNGLTENVIFEYIAAAPTALFALSVTWRAVEKVRSA